MDNFRTAIFLLAWTFTIGLIYMVVNTMMGGYFIPIMNDIANDSSLVQDKAAYSLQTGTATTAFNVACLILVLSPYAYFFVKLLLKKESTSQPYQPGVW
ncbi:MAG: hypothetical protein NTU57_02665 [Candidatus Aenigmarchaeota archaeon]|nr:hypothetical protein [Candidatus Aenigmarchaeota archaeon]